MVSDIAAVVLRNTRLSAGYNVLALSAPAIAAGALPGQFVMLKPQAGLDPLLRRPFSIFEILRDNGRVTGLSILNKAVGVGTRLLYDADPGDVVGVLGPLGRPFVPVSPPEEAWMVAGGVGLAPFATLAEALAARRTPMTLFYGGRSASDLYYADFFAELGATLVLTTEDGSRGEAGRVTGPLERALAARGAAPVTIYACGPTPMMRAVAKLGVDGRPARVRVARTGDGLRPRRLLQLRRPRPSREWPSLRALLHRRPRLRRGHAQLDAARGDWTLIGYG